MQFHAGNVGKNTQCMNLKKSTVIKLCETKTNVKIFPTFVNCKKELINETLHVEEHSFVRSICAE